MSVDWEIRMDFGQMTAALEAAMPFAIEQGAEHIRGVAVSRTPNQTDHLAGSAGVTVSGFGDIIQALIKYPGPYAAYQNRGRRWDGTHVIRKRPAGGMTGFLSVTMVDQREPVLDIVGQVIRDLT